MNIKHPARQNESSTKMHRGPLHFLAAVMTVAVLFLSAASSPINAAAGDLDPSFGTGGIVTTSFFSASVENATAVAIQADGKIIVAGTATMLFVAPGNPNFALARYNVDGSLDTSFDGDGMVITDFTTAPDADHLTSVAIQRDGKIIVAGVTFTNQTSQDFALARYNIDGSLDTSFDGDGKLTTPITTFCYALAIQADGKIVAAGVGTVIAGSSQFMIVRYNVNGSLDTSFDQDGIVATVMGGPFSDAAAHAVGIHSDGKIVAAGVSRGVPGGNFAFAIARYNADGSLDTSFDTDGKVTVDLGTGNHEATAVAIQADGKIVVAGDATVGGNNSQFALVRFRVDGSLDPSFDGDGKAITSVGPLSYARAVAIQSNGKIVAAGFGGGFAIIRHNPDGSLDTTFNGTGKVTTSIGAGSGANAVAIQSDGKIVAAGSARINGSNEDFAVARYIGDADVAAQPAVFDYDGDGKSDISIYRPSLGDWYVQKSRDGLFGIRFGLSTDKIVPADFDGDGKTDIAVYRPSDGIWFVVNSSNGTVSYHLFGLAEDIPVPGDFDGDGKADISVYRPSNGTWYRTNSSDGSFFGRQFGATEDKPMIGDFDGDGRSDLALFRPSNGVWYQIRSQSNTFFGEQFGLGNDIIVPRDYDGDRKTDLAVYRASNGFWYIKPSSTGTFSQTAFGAANDIPAPADYDGDGRADICVFRPSEGQWYRLNSSNGMFNAFPFGTNGDRPTPNAFH